MNKKEKDNEEDNNEDNKYNDIPLDEILYEIKNTPYLNKIYIEEIPLSVRTFLETKYSILTGEVSVKFRLNTLKKLDREKTNELIRILRIATSMYEIKNMIENNKTLQRINSLLEEIKPDIESEELYRAHRDLSDYSIIASRPLPYSPVMRQYFYNVGKKVASTVPIFKKKAHDYSSEIKSSVDKMKMKPHVEPSVEANELYKLHSSSDYSTLPSKYLGGKKTQKKRNKKSKKSKKSKKYKKSKKSKKSRRKFKNVYFL